VRGGFGPDGQLGRPLGGMERRDSSTALLAPLAASQSRARRAGPDYNQGQPLLRSIRPIILPIDGRPSCDTQGGAGVLKIASLDVESGPIGGARPTGPVGIVGRSCAGNTLAPTNEGVVQFPGLCRNCSRRRFRGWCPLMVAAGCVRCS